jgi:hypothetical protein
MRVVEGIEFEDAFAGEEKFGYHLSSDGMYLVEDDWDEVFHRIVETDKFLYFQNDSDDYIMLGKDKFGLIECVAVNNYFASVGLLDSLEQIWTKTGEETLVWMDEKTQIYLPELARDYGWQSGRHDVNNLSFTEVEFLGAAALFAEGRVDKSSIPKPLCAYDIRHTDEDWTHPAAVARSVKVNHLGTLITHSPIKFPGGEPIRLDDQEIDLYSGEQRSIADFAKEHNIRLKTPKERER